MVNIAEIKQKLHLDGGSAKSETLKKNQPKVAAKAEDLFAISSSSAKTGGAIKGNVDSDMNLNSFGAAKQEHDMIGEVGDILLNAMQKRASDIHIEPKEHDVRIRFRVDGNFISYKTLDTQYKDSMIARIKIMAYLRIDEHRLPQDGKISYKLFGNKSVDMRVSIIPTIY